MNKSDIAKKLAEEMNIKKIIAEEVVDIVFDSMTEALKNDDKVEIRGFGSIKNRKYGSYTGRNPKTGEPIKVPEKKLPFFKIGKELKERINRA